MDPPYVKELLDILNIEFEYTDENVLFMKTFILVIHKINQTHGQRISPKLSF